MSARARVFEFGVALDADWSATGDRGGAPLPGDEREAWTPEHLVLAGVTRCVLTSLAFHAGRAGMSLTPGGEAHGTVTRRETDGRFAFVAITARLDVGLEPEPGAEALSMLLAKAERDCFVGASLIATPTYYWTVNGKEIV
jgi:organic hydroperoxide reductase OsmC/OhrA